MLIFIVKRGMILDRCILVFFFALLGASFGSFLNVVAQRSICGVPWWGNARSKCSSCGKVLSWKDIIPLVSWVLLRGKCRYCGEKIAFHHFGAEVVGALIGTLLAWRWGITLPLFFSFVVAFGLLLNALTDIEGGCVFDIFPLCIGMCGIWLRLFGGWQGVLDGISGAASGFSVIACIIFLSRGGMGWGDATLMAGTGVVLGWKFTLLTLYLGFMAGGIISLGLLLAGKLHRKDAVPLVPFLTFGGVLTLLLGPWILSLGNISSGWPW